MERRGFLKSVTAAGLPLATYELASAVETISEVAALPRPDETVRNGMRYRTLGQTGVEVSAIGLGGYHIGGQKAPPDSLHIIRTAIDRGITFLDNSWDYHDGESERRMGQALRNGYRDKVFLMTKLDGRDKPTAAKQLDESLRRLGTDHVDLIQIHEVIRLEDPDRVFAEGGAIEALLAARQSGKVRFIGFTGHKDPLVHLRMLDVAAQHDFRFDTVQMPLNVMDAHFRSFARQVVPVLVAKKIGVLGMKPMADKLILQSKTATPIECLHYALNLPTSVVITGIDSLPILDQAFEAAKTFRRLSDQDLAALLSRTKQAALTGRFEQFKTNVQFDSTALHPEWLGGGDVHPKPV